MTTDSDGTGASVPPGGGTISETGEFAPPNLRKDTLYVRVAQHVKELIDNQELAPGDRLPTERQLAQMLGVSRVPIREAIRTLSAQGVVEVRRGQGMFVASKGIDATIDELTNVLMKQRDSFEDLFAVRRILEPASAQWAASRAGSEEVAKLKGIVDEMDEAGTAEPEPDFERMAQLDLELHVEIATAAENKVLVRIMEAIQDVHREQLETSLRYRGRIEQTLKDHRRIVEAIAGADPVEARSAMVDHVANSAVATFGRIGGDE